MGLIAWVDIEATGKDEKADPILEIGLVLTSSAKGFTRIARQNWVIRPRDVESAEQRMKNGDDSDPEFVWRMHNGNGLWPLCLEEGIPLKQAEDEIMALVRQHNPQRGGKVTLGGSGVAQYDYRFLLRQTPDFGSILNYFSYDIGCVRRVAMLSGVRAPAEVSDGSKKNHRAIDDIDKHLGEARWFARLFEAAKKAGIVSDLAGEDAEL